MPRCSEKSDAFHESADVCFRERASELADWLAFAERHDGGECPHLHFETHQEGACTYMGVGARRTRRPSRLLRLRLP